MGEVMNIIELAKQAGFQDADWNYIKALAKFADLIAAHEREACAKVCEQSEIPMPIDVWHGSTKKEMTAYTALALAAAIRARGTS
jgi:hypothetical protein